MNAKEIIRYNVGQVSLKKFIPFACDSLVLAIIDTGDIRYATFYEQPRAAEQLLHYFINV